MTQNDRVREIRKSLNLTMEKFGERIGIKKAAVSKIENGVNNLTEQIAKAICREYNVNEEWLLNGNGEMFNVPEDEIAEIVSKFIENPESELYQVILKLVHTYAELTPDSQKVLDQFAKKLLEDMKK